MDRHCAAVKSLRVFVIMLVLVWSKGAGGFVGWNGTAPYDDNEESFLESEIDHVEIFHGGSGGTRPLLVGLTLIYEAAAAGAVCLDGSLPGYHIHRGYGSGILSDKPQENPDFFNWNRVKLRYCDGASFSGDSQDEKAQLYFRGERIWSAAMEHLMSNGMRYANQALLSGCSAGGLASILHCDKFKELFPSNTRVKCLSDAGLFLDVMDISGGRTLRRMFGGLVRLQGVQKNLPQSCTNHLNPILCFFPQRLIDSVRTPLFLLNAAYDSWQILASLAPPSADFHGRWQGCRKNFALCDASQIRFLQGFRNQMVTIVRGFLRFNKNGMFLNSCFAHCQTERQDTWFGYGSPHIRNRGIAKSVGDWYFDRVVVKVIDCPYPCDNTCHNLVFK
ncbi:hypothetical protein SLE2022_092780 [Rubroshorea leprosula]